MMRNIFSKIIIAIAAVFIAVQVFALQIPERSEGRVNDFAGFFSQRTAQDLNAQLTQYEQETTNQIVIATFPSLEGENLEDFSIRLAEKWKVGQKGKDNGVIVLIFSLDRAVRIETGYGVEAVLTDALCSQIINDIILPYFKNGDYDTGIRQGVAAIMTVLEGKLPANKTRRSSGRQVSSFLPIFIFIILIILRAVLFSGINQRLGTRRYRGGGFWGGGFGGSGFGGGGGGFSGGGGSFGGGGASGRW